MRHISNDSKDFTHMRNWLRHRAWPVLYDTWAGFMKHDGLMLSAAMAYAAAFSLFPLCLVLMAVLGFITRFSSQVQSEQQQLLATVSERVSPWLAQQMGSLLAGVQSRAFFGGPLGIITLIVGASLFSYSWRPCSTASGAPRRSPRRDGSVRCGPSSTVA